MEWKLTVAPSASPLEIKVILSAENGAVGQHKMKRMVNTK